MSFSIRLATREDAQSILGLIVELAVFEKEPNAVEITVQDILNDGFGVDKKFVCFVAEQASEVVGIALVYARYSTWKGSVLHLEDLIVKQSMRGTGLGTALLDEVVKYAARLKVKRVSWEVIDWNEPAIKFYEQKGAKVMRDWDVVQLDENGIKNYLSKI